MKIQFKRSLPFNGWHINGIISAVEDIDIGLHMMTFNAEGFIIDIPDEQIVDLPWSTFKIVTYNFVHDFGSGDVPARLTLECCDFGGDQGTAIYRLTVRKPCTSEDCPHKGPFLTIADALASVGLSSEPDGKTLSIRINASQFPADGDPLLVARLEVSDILGLPLDTISTQWANDDHKEIIVSFDPSLVYWRDLGWVDEESFGDGYVICAADILGAPVYSWIRKDQHGFIYASKKGAISFLVLHIQGTA